MIKKISNREVRGSNFTILVQGIHQIRYIGNDRVALIEIEGGLNKNGEVNWLVYKETLKGWEPPHEMDKMTENDRMEIFINISKSLALLEMPHKFL